MSSSNFLGLCVCVCVLILYVPENYFSVMLGRFLSSWVEPVLSRWLSDESVPPVSLDLATIRIKSSTQSLPLSQYQYKIFLEKVNGKNAANTFPYRLYCFILSVANPIF